jgi:hypothetical protein
VVEGRSTHRHNNYSELGLLKHTTSTPAYDDCVVLQVGNRRADATCDSAAVPMRR